MENKKLYSNMVGLTSQFRFCGNPFRIDTYRGCGFGCQYCFANNRNGKGFAGKNNRELGDIRVINNFFKKLENEKEYADINVELARHRVPLHLGGMSDPFQKREFRHGLTKELLKLSVLHKYPVIISTKVAFLPQEYFDILDPTLHTFQISLMSTNEEMISVLELNTPSAKERINFIKELHSKGFWVGLRIQPMIDVHEAEKLLLLLKDDIDYCTVEHLKLPKFNTVIWNKILPFLSRENKKGFRSNHMKPEFEISKNLKIKHILYLKEKFPTVKFGCGDNEIHEYSDSLNCCGVDLMPKAFNNWLKYNSMYIKMTGNKTQWVPEKSCSGCFNSSSNCIKLTYKENVDTYFTSLYGKNDGFFKI